jgi:predicted Zn-dependent protease
MNDVFETIEAYLNGSLSAAERQQFEEKLKNDPGLAEAFRTYRGIEVVMKNKPAGAKDTEALKQSLKQLGKKHFTGKRSVKRDFFNTWRAVAAIVIVVVGAALWLLLKPADKAHLYAKYAVHAPLDINSRSSANDRLASNAARAFNAKQYERAAALLDTYNKREPDDIEMQMAKGICYLELDKVEEARQIFNGIAGGLTAFAYSAQWYLALAYLKEKKYDQCRTALSIIPADAGEYEKAQRLIKELK